MAWHRSSDMPVREGRARAPGHETRPKVELHAAPDTPSVNGGFTFASSVLPALLVASVSLVALVSVACLVHRRRRRRRLWDLDEQGSYERLAATKQAPLARDGAPSLEDLGGPKGTSCRRGIRRSTEPVFYGCLAQDRPIDFVVPTLLGSSQAGSIASLVSSSDANSSPMDAASGTAGQPCPSPGDPLPGIPTSLLGGLNPELYRVSSGDGAFGGPDDGEERSFPESHRGRLWFALHYEDARESLELRVLKARNLPSRVCGSVNCCDPFVRIQLLPDERRYQQTKFKKKTCNPVFDESYIFQIPGKALSERVLKLTVLDNDRGKRHNVIGHVLFPLKDLDPISGERVVAWRDLEAKADVATPEQGELLLALCYKASHERLTVTVLEARGLSAPSEMGPPETPLDTQVKVSFLMENKPVKSKKTSVCKRNCEPKFMESFGFKVSPAGLSAASVILKLSCLAPPHKDRCLGRVVLGSFMFARGQAQQHWTDAMAAAPKQIHRWHKLS